MDVVKIIIRDKMSWRRFINEIIELSFRLLFFCPGANISYYLLKSKEKLQNCASHHQLRRKN